MTLRCHYRGFWSVNSALGGRSPASSKRRRIWITDIRHFASSEHACTPIRVSSRCSQRPAMPVVRVGARAASSEGRTCRLGPTRTSPLARGPARSHSEEHEQWSRRHPLPSTHTVSEVLWVTRHGLARASFPGPDQIRTASWTRSGTHTPVSSPARCSRANVTASRRFVLTRSPGRFGIRAGATTMQSWPRSRTCRHNPYPSAGPRSRRAGDHTDCRAS